MNVRFFAGTKQQYLNLPAPRNPLALYFCADSQELFWGDKLLTDGVRVVNTISDLPTCIEAAEGIIYYVSDTRNGYVVSPDKSEWLQTIYAPLRKGEEVKEGTEDITVTTVGAVNHLIEEVYKYIDSQIDAAGNADLSKLATKEELEAAIRAIEHPTVDLEDYATKTFVVEELGKINIPDTSNFITMQEVEDKNYLTKVPEEFATEEFVNKKIAEAELADKEADLEAYYTKSEVDAKIPSLEGYAKTEDIPTDYVKVSDLEAYSKFSGSYKDLTDKPEIPTVDGLASEVYVDNKFAEVEVFTKVSELENDAKYITLEDIPETDLSSYYDKSETETLVNEAINGIELPSVEGLVTEESVNEKLAAIVIPEIPTNISAFNNDAGYLTEHQDLSEYAKKSDIPQPELFAVNYSSPDYNAAIAAYRAGKLLILMNANPDPESYAIMNYANEKYITFTKFLVSRSETYGAFNTYYLKPDNTWDIAKEVILNKVEATSDEPSAGDLSAVRIGKNIYSIPQPQSLDGYATEQYVDSAIAAIPSQDLSGYALKSEIPVISNLVSTETLNTSLMAKANDVPFTEDKIVGNAVGGFAVGDSIKGLTVVEVFAKLLGLSTEVNNPEEPEIPSIPGEDATVEDIINYLIDTQATMYSQDETGALTETPFAVNVWSVSEAASEMSDISAIYKVVDDNNALVEAGYQEATQYNEEAWLTIALPSVVKNVKVKKYDPDVSDWVYVNWEVVKETEQNIPGYTIWTVPEMYEVMSGSTYRFVIVD